MSSLIGREGNIGQERVSARDAHLRPTKKKKEKAEIAKREGGKWCRP